MKTVRSLVPVLVVAGLGCGGVKGVDQKSDAELVTYASPKAAELPAGTVKKETLLIGTKEAHERIPAELEWEVAKDAAGCLRIKRVSLKRTGGPTSVEIYDAKVTPPKDDKCATSTLDGFTDPFEIVQVSYCWRWNGAVNTDKCAYSSSATLRADNVGVESMDKMPAASSSAR